MYTATASRHPNGSSCRCRHGLDCLLHLAQHAMARRQPGPGLRHSVAVGQRLEQGSSAGGVAGLQPGTSQRRSEHPTARRHAVRPFQPQQGLGRLSRGGGVLATLPGALHQGLPHAVVRLARLGGLRLHAEQQGVRRRALHPRLACYRAACCWVATRGSWTAAASTCIGGKRDSSSAASAAPASRACSSRCRASAKSCSPARPRAR